MARTIRINLTGDAEELVKQLMRQGLSEQEIIGKALTLLRMAQQSKVVQVDEKGNMVGTLSLYPQYQQTIQMQPPDK